MAHTRKRQKKSEKPTWWEDTGFAKSDDGVDEAKTFHGDYKGWHIEVYPTKLIGKELKGWEYELWHDKKAPDGWDSLFETSTGGDHAKTSSEAKRWAINTIDGWD